MVGTPGLVARADRQNGLKPRPMSSKSSGSKGTIAVIEDEPDILEVIAYILAREGYEVIHAVDGESGLDEVRSRLPDLVLLDLMLPGLDGMEVCRQLRSDPRTRAIPLVMVTAKGGENDVVSGLRTGADDYVTKPFSPRELAARVEAVLRRVAGGEPANDREKERLVRDGLVIDSASHEVQVDGEVRQLTATEFRLLHCLARRPGRVFSRDQLLTRVLGGDAYIVDRNIDVHVGAIRRKLGRYRDLIETIRGVGYRFRSAGTGGN